MADVDLPGWGKKRTIHLDGDDIVLDPQNLRFTDATLNQFFELVSGFCDYYGQKLADANRAVSRAEQLFERLYIQKFKEYREGVGGESGKSEKTSELYSKAEPEVSKAKSDLHEMTHKRDSIWNHLKALNAAREDAHQRGHFIRKEMEALNTSHIMQSSDDGVATDSDSDVMDTNIASVPKVPPKKSNWRRPEDPEMEKLFQEVEKKGGHN